jgi:serine/threonine protein kinase
MLFLKKEFLSRSITEYVMEKTPSFRVHAFGHYYLLERIAVGGMAEIFKAKQVGVRGFEKIIVIKKILQHLSEDPEFVEMFEDEAKIAARLTQANIVQIYELGEVDGTLYIAMEYIEGRNLRDITRAASGKGLHLPVEQCVMIMTEVLKGLDYAHRKTDSSGVPLSIIHRDMSPQNIILSYEGEVKILDFGIAKAASKISKTEAGVLKGKFSYMSPEQASGKMIAQTSDIYACGVILHELLTSDRLFRAKTDIETLERVKEGKVLPPSEKNDQIPPELDAIALKALTKDPAHRYQTAGEMLTDLTRLAYEKKYSFGSQDLTAFMNILFEEDIADEKRRLQRALSEVPASPSQIIQNARTHIAFKAPMISGDPKQNDANAETFQKENTGSAQVERTRFQPRKLFRVAAITVILLFVGFLIWPKRPLPQIPEKNIPSDSSPTENTAAPSEIEIKIPVLPKPKDNPVTTILKPIEGEENISDSHEPSKKNRRQPPKPSPADIEGGSAPVIKSAVRMGKIDVIAPPTGFAQLFIDGQSRGTVPGPNAREIPLAAGNHAVRCETSTQVYSGFIQVKPDENEVIHCQDLK